MSGFEFDDKGLIPVVVQDHITGEVLMVAWANEEAIAKMKETGYTHFWSRSRQKLWMKGEEAGNTQKIVSIQSDCDDDTLLVRVIQKNDCACHTGNPTCFFKTIYGDPSSTSMILSDLRRVIHDRKMNPEEGSYTCKLFKDETKMCKKIVEEATEYVLAIKDKDKDEVAWELADLIYHTMVAMEKEGVDMKDVYEKLAERR